MTSDDDGWRAEVHVGAISKMRACLVFSCFLCIAVATVVFRRDRPEYVDANVQVMAAFFVGVREHIVLCLLLTLPQKKKC